MSLFCHLISKKLQSDKYLVGSTTFYSFPTPSSQSSLAGVAGVEKLLKSVLEQVSKMETERILSYPFTDYWYKTYILASTVQGSRGRKP
jgi:hypothetical protein